MSRFMRARSQTVRQWAPPIDGDPGTLSSRLIIGLIG